MKRDDGERVHTVKYLWREENRARDKDGPLFEQFYV